MLPQKRKNVRITTDNKIKRAPRRTCQKRKHDSLIVYRQPHAVDPAAVGVLSIIKLREGITMLAKLEKARKTGEATIETSDGKTREVEIEAATPVLVMLP